MTILFIYFSLKIPKKLIINNLPKCSNPKFVDKFPELNGAISKADDIKCNNKIIGKYCSDGSFPDINNECCNNFDIVDLKC